MNAYPQFYDLVTRRYSCRNYSDRKVPEDLLVAILDIVRLAPSACNRQPWRFLVIDDAVQSEVLRKSYSREWFDNAPLYIVAIGMHDEAWHRGFDGKDHTAVDVAIAVEHLCLAATSVGLGTCWVCNFDPAIVKEGLNLPDNAEPIAIIPIGYPVDGEAVPEKKRKALDDIVKWGKF
ncbi:MAG: nitroreductase family protein [Muribaculum sp.]